MDKKRKLALHWKVIIGMVAGILWGMLSLWLHWEIFTMHWIKPWGTLFMRLLTMLAVPLILVSLINGVGSLSDVSKLSRIGVRTLGFYLSTTVIAIVFGLLLVNIIEPGKVFPEGQKADLQERYASTVEARQSAARQVAEEGPLDFMLDVVPANPFKAMTDNGSMLQVIFFALLFGIALVMVPSSKTAPVKKVVEGLNDIVLMMINLVMRFAPYGVFALLGALFVDMGGERISDSFSIFAALGLYAFAVISGLLLMIMVIYPLILKIFTKIPYKNFAQGILPAQLLAFSTSSSAATLPVTMECCEQNLGIKRHISSFVLPIGATVNMDGTSLYQAVAALFIAQVYGIQLDFIQQLTIVFTATMASIGAAAVPSAGIIMLVVVLSSVGIPTEGIALILAVDRPFDMLRTVVNITGDCTITSIIGHAEKAIDYDVACSAENVVD